MLRQHAPGSAVTILFLLRPGLLAGKPGASVYEPESTPPPPALRSL